MGEGKVGGEQRECQGGQEVGHGQVEHPDRGHGAAAQAEAHHPEDQGVLQNAQAGEQTVDANHHQVGLCVVVEAVVLHGL